MPPKTDSEVRKPRAFDKTKYELKYLRFLGEFMTAAGLTTTTAGEKIGISQVSIYYWLKKDDAHIATVMKLIEACGYRMEISLVPEEQDNEGFSIELRPSRSDKRLSFLADALKDVDKEELAAKIGMGYSTIYYWLKHDDMYISYIYRIAEAIGRKVKITIRPQ